MATQLQGTDERLNSYVLPLAVVSDDPEQQGVRLESIEGTGFLVAGGRGLGVTARHVADELAAADAANRISVAMFTQPGAPWLVAPITTVDRHPVEDVALFRLPDDDYFSPFTMSASQEHSSASYELWGYPDDIHHDRMKESGALAPDLVYSTGHIRRRISYDVPAAPGVSFYELSSPAGRGASGAPVTVLREPLLVRRWQAVGVYVGERRNETGTLAVGYAARCEALTEYWPALFGGDLSTLCDLGHNKN